MLLGNNDVRATGITTLMTEERMGAGGADSLETIDRGCDLVFLLMLACCLRRSQPSLLVCSGRRHETYPR